MNSVLMEAMHSVPHSKKYHVCPNNLLFSLSLLTHLINKEITCTGTVLLSRI